MVKLHNEMIIEIGSDSDALELFDELVETATRYAVFRTKWPLMSKEEKMDTYTSRSACHNSLIVEDDKYNRKRIGDFGYYIVLISSINAR